MFIPFAAGSSGLNRDTALLLLFHEVRCGFAIVDFTGLMNLAGQLEDAFRRRRLARVYVGKNADISVKAKVFVFHVATLLFCSWHQPLVSPYRLLLSQPC